jgi:hypothetical protein
VLPRGLDILHRVDDLHVTVFIINQHLFSSVTHHAMLNSTSLEVVTTASN